MRPEQVDLPGAEAKLGYTFSNRLLGETALDPSVRGFSRLEFLGDSILGVVIFTMAESAELPRPQAQNLVSNQRFRQLFETTFAAHSPGNTGDVIEALVGAIYLDGGFDHAASIISRVIEPQFGQFDQAALSTKAGAMQDRGLMQIGAHVTSAVVADHLCTLMPSETHEVYSKERSRLIHNERLAQRSRDLGLATADERIRPISKRDAVHADALDAHVAHLFLRRGWHAAKPDISGLIGL
jgi:dsRNA-specific ribonuclease